MRIAHVTVSLVKAPVDRPYVAGGREVRGHYYVLARLTTSDGITGFGYGIVMQDELTASLTSATRELAGVLIGRHVLEVESAWESLREAGRWLGPGGLLHHAIAPLDIAMWDAAAKSLEQPLHRLLGGYRDRVPAYESAYLWNTIPVQELIVASRAYRDLGFKAIKLRAGRESDPREEIRRVCAVREAVGPDIRILVDAIESWNVPRAVGTGRLLQEAGIEWLEDPVPTLNFAGLSEVVRRLEVPIAAGENLYSLEDFLRLFDTRVAIAIIDLGRIGGITPWRRVAAVARGHGVLVCGHILPEFHIHLLAATPNAYMIEHHHGRGELLESTLQLEDGSIVAPLTPGLGFALNEELVRRFTVG